MPFYEILINAGCSVKDPLIYKYSNTKNIELHIKKDRAAIRYYMSVAKSPEEMIAFKAGVFKDAYRKVFLLHGVLFDRDINVRTITVAIDGVSVVYDKDTEGFPFVYSMISKLPMHLSESWQSKEFCLRLIESPKSKSNNDYRQISVLAFLCSKGRPYIIDRFTNLWTSMNAYYNWYADLYNEFFRKKYHYDAKYYEMMRKRIPEGKMGEFDNLRSETLSNGRKYPFIVSGDTNCIKLLMESIHKNGAFIKSSQFENDITLRAMLHRFESRLCSLSDFDLQRLYSYSVLLLSGSQAASNDEFFDIFKLIQGMNRQNLYFFLVLEYPYICRCNYLHGSKALLLLSYENEFEIRRLKAASFFVEKFLSERIPMMITGVTKMSDDILSSLEKKVDSKNLNIMENHKKAAENLIDC